MPNFDLSQSLPPAQIQPPAMAALACGALLSLLLLSGCTRPPAHAKAPEADGRPHIVAASDIDAGRYLIVSGTCNDCHTPGWAQAPETVKEQQWLIGSNVGWRGPWGTTYATNLRLVVDGMTEDDFVKVAHERKERPPMPWVTLNRMHESDVRMIYRYIKSLGPAGEAMPAPLPPGVEPKTPFVVLAPPTVPASAS